MSAQLSPDSFEHLAAQALELLAHRVVRPELRATGGRCVPRALLIEQREHGASWRIVVLPITSALSTRTVLERRPELRLAVTSQGMQLGCLLVPMPVEVEGTGAFLVDFWSPRGEHRMATIRRRADTGAIEAGFESGLRVRQIETALAVPAAPGGTERDTDDAGVAFDRTTPSIADVVAHLNGVASRCAHLAAKVRRRDAERAERALDARVLASRIETLERERDALRQMVEALRRRVDVDRALAEVRDEAADRRASHLAASPDLRRQAVPAARG